jgi:hypothetical protein
VLVDSRGATDSTHCHCIWYLAADVRSHISAPRASRPETRAPQSGRALTVGSLTQYAAHDTRTHISVLGVNERKSPLLERTQGKDALPQANYPTWSGVCFCLAFFTDLI